MRGNIQFHTTVVALTRFRFDVDRALDLSLKSLVAPVQVAASSAMAEWLLLWSLTYRCCPSSVELTLLCP